jgi:hypothetical protein
MPARRAPRSALDAWLEIPSRLEAAAAGRSARALDRRGGEHGWSPRETIHHLVEANLVAAGMIIAAMGKSGSTFDWTWLNPDRAWMRRLGDDRAPVAPAIAALRAVGRHLGGLVRAARGARSRTVVLFDTPGGRRYRRTVEAILREEAGHAAEHLAALREATRAPRTAGGRKPTG